MDYTEQFIRLNCSLMSDYKMMKLNADMKCMGLGLYLETILFLRKQQEYRLQDRRKRHHSQNQKKTPQPVLLPIQVCKYQRKTKQRQVSRRGIPVSLFQNT